MPQILPRIRALGDKFGHFAYMLALIFRSARLLPEGHPMVNPINIGRYGIREVIATTANRLEMRRENIDQILIFAAVVLSLVMIAMQTVMLVFYATIGTAHAAGGASSSMFSSPGAAAGTDVMLRFLGNVFGIDSIFAGGVTQPGLYALMKIYSNSMMVIAVLVVLYYIVVIVGESAQSGKPFGRMNGLWAPIRLVLALGLLVPLGTGINAAQYLTLYVAKFGSGLATQGWIAYTNAFVNSSSATFKSSSPNVAALAQAVFESEACMYAYNQITGLTGDKAVRLYMEYTDNTIFANAKPTPNFTSADLILGKKDGSITYKWGTGGYSGDAMCGTISIKVKNNTTVEAGGNSTNNTAVQNLQVAYLTAIKTVIDGGRQTAEKIYAKSNEASPTYKDDSAITNESLSQSLATVFTNAQTGLNDTISGLSWDIGPQPLFDRMKNDATDRGWGTAGAYYLQMSKIVQAVRDAVAEGFPTPISSPNSASFTNTLSGYRGSDTPQLKRMQGVLANSRMVALGAVRGMQATGQIRAGEVPPETKFSSRGSPSDLIRDPVAWGARVFFGDAFVKLVDGDYGAPMQTLIEGGAEILNRAHFMVKFYAVAQAAAISPKLAGAAAGVVLTDDNASTFTKLAAATAGFIGVSVAEWFVDLDGIARLIASLAGIIWFFIVIGIGAGIILFYLLPLLPFMYFFFSAVNWVVEVAEAFVSMPLFALSHLRIDGDGLPGQAAMQGYLTLFGIMIRPIMIIAGFVVGNLIFTAGAGYLNAIFKYAVASYAPATNGAGGILDFSKISGFSLVTYTVIYVYMLYMLANSSFKLIDMIPDKMMRWIGGPTPFTGDRPVDIGTMQGAALATWGTLNQANQAVSGLSKLGGARRQGEQSGVGVSG